MNLQMTRGIFEYILASAWRSRLLYLHILIVGIATLFAAFVSNLTEISQSSEALDISRVGARMAVSNLGSALLFLVVFASSRNLPWMLGSGLVGFFVARPISRDRLLLLVSVSILVSYSLLIVVGSLIFGVVSTTSFPQVSFTDVLLQVALETLIFALYVPIIVLFGVLTRSGSLAFMAAFAIWLFAWLLASREGVLTLLDNDLLWKIADTLYYVLPKSSEISELWWPSSLAGGKDSLMPLWSTVITSAVAYVLATLKFRKLEL